MLCKDRKNLSTSRFKQGVMDTKTATERTAESLLISVLRSETKPAHALLEEKHVLKSMRSVPPDLHAWCLGYQTIAQGYCHLVDAIEQFEADQGAFPDESLYEVASAYRQDLQRLLADGLLKPVEVPPPAPLASRSEAFGVIWCLKGSRHGARLLLRYAKTSFGQSISSYMRALAVQDRAIEAAKAESRIVSRVQDVTGYDCATALEGAIASFAYFARIADRVEEMSNGR